MKLMRNVAIVGLTWGVVWAALALLVGAVIGFIDPAQIDSGEQPIALAPIIGLVGLGCGLIYAPVVALADPRRVHRALLGLAIGAVLPLLLGQGLAEMIVTALAGALAAWVASFTASSLATDPEF